MRDGQVTCVIQALGMVRTPTGLEPTFDYVAKICKGAEPVSLTELADHLSRVSAPDPVVGAFGNYLAQRDMELPVGWCEATGPYTRERRRSLYDHLGIADTRLASVAEDRFTPELKGFVVVTGAVAGGWHRLAEKRFGRPMTDSYARHLSVRKGIDDRSLSVLMAAAERTVSHWANPLDPRGGRQTKGLAMGLVQSGKTSYFNAVLARAIDSGHKLIIVLTGSKDDLRNQSQVRFEQDVSGWECLTVTPEDVSAYISHSDRDWLGPECIFDFLTTSERDYQSGQTASVALSFQAPDRNLPYCHPDNLARAPIKIVFVKKNGPILRRFINDLIDASGRPGSTPLSEIPGVVVDDESDHVSVNISAKDRSPVNSQIVRMLKTLRRAQYLGVTATPYANLVGLSGDEELFPDDYLILLEPGPGYMGIGDFFDEQGRPVKEHVRPVSDPDDDRELLTVLCSFVVAGAIKLYRRAEGVAIDDRHHSMMLIESVMTSDHAALKERVKRLFLSGGFVSGQAVRTMEELYGDDFRKTWQSKASQEPYPPTFEALWNHVPEVLSRLGDDPVEIVNSKVERSLSMLDGMVWKIFVGGAALSRGITVPGLTTSYVTRVPATVDTLMQMARFAGYRHHYPDTVRVFLGQGTSRKGLRLDRAFVEGYWMEEAFREVTRACDSDATGRAWRPADVLVEVRQFGDMPPTSAPKLRHAVRRKLDAERGYECGFLRHEDAQANLSALTGFLDRADFTEETKSPNFKVFEASRDDVVACLAAMRYGGAQDEVDQDLRRVSRHDQGGTGRDTWLVLVAQPAGPAASLFPGGPAFTRSTRQAEEKYGAKGIGKYPISTSNDLSFAESLAGWRTSVADAKPARYDDYVRMMRGKSGILLVYLISPAGRADTTLVGLRTVHLSPSRIDGRGGDAVPPRVPRKTYVARSAGSVRRVARRGA